MDDVDLEEEMQPSVYLRDMRLVYEGTAADPPTRGQAMLQQLFEKEPDKFMQRMERLQLSHDKKVEAIETRLAAESGGAVDEVDEDHLRLEELCEELLAKATSPEPLSPTSKPKATPV
jgi:hypothetical protein